MPYTFQNMDVPGAAGGTSAEGINNAGQITGSYTAGESPTLPYDPYPQAFIRTPGSADIISIGGNPYGQHSLGYDINNAGQMVGQSGHYEETGRGFVRNTDGTFTRIEYTGDGAFTYAYGNNDNGAVVGQAFSFDATKSPLTQPVGFVWKNGQITDTFSVPGSTQTSTTGINNSGLVVGTYRVGQDGDPSSTQHGYMGWDSKHIWGVDVPGASSTEIWDITNTGEVVGTFQDAQGHSHGFVDLAGHFDQVDMPGATNTFIYGANDSGQIVGSYNVAGDPNQHAFEATPLDQQQCAVGENYLAAFGREVDAGGMNFWAGLLKAGLTASQLSQDLAGSPEFHSLHDQQNDRDYVDSIYADGLGRQADQGGESYWVGVLQSGTGRSDVLAAIAQSPEGQQHFAATHA
jgi:uncharacterized membrane protein